ncbi:hypothetical protein E0H36_05335 [Rhizobium leguminosarum bv. viciae]|uniref:hypothetical protein n=1 Tax=Rhizobium leguminosarum TaxID=384 RepID=UPI001039517E|nr:hypothetical protein [Rhizobium leguminosarum]TBZ36446.1 hypothetical protein E0H36_05335 [Rhizobium leguminosarum bv. viciae]
MEQGNWEASYVVLVRRGKARVSGRNVGPFSQQVSDALQKCAPVLGSFANENAWRRTRNVGFRTGVVLIGGQAFYQYQTHRLRWRLQMTGTGRAYRITNFKVQSFGAISKVPTGRNVRTTVEIGFGPFDQKSEKVAAIEFSPLALSAVTASCGGGGIRLSGPSARAEDGVWREAILGRPFNAEVEITEEVLR